MVLHEKLVKNAVIMFAEFLGTFLLMFFGCMGSIVLFTSFGAVAFALTVLTVIQIFGHISGAHFNPSVTIAACIAGKLQLILAPLYVAAQFLGAFAGYGILSLLIDTDTNGYCATVPSMQTTNIQALFIEMIITGTFVLSLCAVWDEKNSSVLDSVSLRLCFILMCIFLVAAPLTGASLNTPRSLAPAVFNNIWKDHWVYWVGPNLGAAIAAVLYKYIFNNI